MSLAEDDEEEEEVERGIISQSRAVSSVGCCGWRLFLLLSGIESGSESSELCSEGARPRRRTERRTRAFSVAPLGTLWGDATPSTAISESTFALPAAIPRRVARLFWRFYSFIRQVIYICLLHTVIRPFYYYTVQVRTVVKF